MRVRRAVSIIMLLMIITKLLAAPSRTSAQDLQSEELSEEGITLSQAQSTRVVTLSDAQAYRYLWHHQYSYRWNLDLQTASTAEDSTGKNQGDGEAMRLEGTVKLVPVQQLGNGNQVLQATVVVPHLWAVEDDGSLVDVMTSEMAAQLAKPFYAVQTPQGKVEYVVFAKDESVETQNIKRGIVSSLQVQLDDVATSEVVELDTNGAATTSYTRQAINNVVTVVRERDDNDFTRFADPTIDTDVTDIHQRFEAAFDPAIGTVTAITTTDRFISAKIDEASYSGEGFGVWSEAAGQGGLKLETISSTPVTTPLPNFASTANQTAVVDGISRTWGTEYQAGSLMATYVATPENVDPALDVPTALAQIAAAPEDYGKIDQLRRLLASSETHLQTLAEVLRNRRFGTSPHPSIAAALSGVGTPLAQSLIIDLLVLDTTLSEQVRSDALVSLLSLKAPHADTIAALQTLGDNTSDPLAPQAVLVLGGVLHTYAKTQPEAAADIVRSLEKILLDTADETTIELYLNALGNAGDAQSIDVIKPYLEHSSSAIRIAALDALRKLSPQQTTALIVEAQSDLDPDVAQLADSMQHDLAAQQMNSMQLANPFLWSRQVGGGNIYGVLHAKLEATKPNGNLKLYADAGVDIHLWKTHRTDVVKATATSELVNQNTRNFKFNLKVLNNTVMSYTKDILCGHTFNGTLWDKKQPFFTASYTYWVYGFNISFSASVGGSVALNYQIGYTGCTLDNSKVWAQLKPGTWIWANGGVGIGILKLVEVGVTVELSFLRTWLPATVSGVRTDGDLQFCSNLSLEFKPIGVSIIGWFRWWRLLKQTWGYKQFTIYSKEHSGYNQTLVDYCMDI